MPRTSPTLRARICALLDSGHSITAVSFLHGLHRSTVSRIYRKYKEGGGYEDKPRTGRPKVFTDRNERSMIRKLMKGECANAEELRKVWEGPPISTQTIQNALQRNGLKGRSTRKKPLLKKTHRKRRLAFAKKYRHWSLQDWHRVVWSDESKFNVFGSDGRSWCWRKDGQALRDVFVKPTVKHGGGSVMVWGCMTSQGVGNLCCINGGLDAELYTTILKEDYLDTLDWYALTPKETIFQHDNDPKHKAKLTQAWLKDHEIAVLDWPAQSPDLNPIEHLWNEVERRLKQHPEPPTRQSELWEKLEEVWNGIEADVCLKLINTMPERIMDVIKAKGGYTRW
jgi:transposase